MKKRRWLRKVTKAFFAGAALGGAAGMLAPPKSRDQKGPDAGEDPTLSETPEPDRQRTPVEEPEPAGQTEEKEASSEPVAKKAAAARKPRSTGATAEVKKRTPKKTEPSSQEPPSDRRS